MMGDRSPSTEWRSCWGMSTQVDMPLTFWFISFHERTNTAPKW
jgi:hypothetical protein